MAMSISLAARNARLAALVTSVGNNGTLRYYSGTRPAAVGAISTQTLLATLTFSGAFGTVANGTLTWNTVTQNSASHVNGNPTWIRVSASDGTPVFDMDIGSGSGNMQFTGTIATGTNITLDPSTFAEPSV